MTSWISHARRNFELGAYVPMGSFHLLCLMSSGVAVLYGDPFAPSKNFMYLKKNIIKIIFFSHERLCFEINCFSNTANVALIPRILLHTTLHTTRRRKFSALLLPQAKLEFIFPARYCPWWIHFCRYKTFVVIIIILTSYARL